MNSKLRHIVTFAVFVAAGISAPVGVASDSEVLPLPAMSFTKMKLNIFAEEVRTNRVFLVFKGGASDAVRVEMLKECTLTLTAGSPDGKLYMEARWGLKTQTITQTITGGFRAAVEIGGERCIEVAADQMTVDRTPGKPTK